MILELFVIIVVVVAFAVEVFGAFVLLGSAILMNQSQLLVYNF